MSALAPGDGRAYGSPNKMVWEYFAALRRVAKRAANLGKSAARNEAAIRREAFVSVVVGVAVVEAFMNARYRTLATWEARYQEHNGLILGDLRRRVSLESKLKRWPMKLHGKVFALDSGIGKRFDELRRTRNEFIHVDGHETIEPSPGIIVTGLIDTSTYHNLDASSPTTVADVVQRTVGHLLRIEGLPESQVREQVHFWLGEMVPDDWTP